MKGKSGWKKMEKMFAVGVGLYNGGNTFLIQTEITDWRIKNQQRGQLPEGPAAAINCPEESLWKQPPQVDSTLICN